MDIVEEVLSDAKAPMRSQEIWEVAKTKYPEKVSNYLNKKTPPHLIIYNMLNQDIRNKPDTTIFARVSKNPILFALKNKKYTETQIIKKIEQIEKSDANEVKASDDTQNSKNNNNKYNESDLHPVLAMFVYNNDHFNCLVKTIRQQLATKSKRSNSGQRLVEKWTYPDLMGVYVPYSDYDQITNSLLSIIKQSEIKVFSFEIKKVLNSSNLRESFFQTVSNSSWAHEGYLVAAEISDDPEFNKELTMLCNSFGIGVIKLDIESPNDSQIFFNAKPREKIDVDVVDKLVSKSTEVKTFFKALDDMEKLQRKSYQEFDHVYSIDEYERIVRAENGIGGLSGRKK